MLGKRRAKVVRDPLGRVWRRGVDVEQVAIGGFGTSLVYWRIGLADTRYCVQCQRTPVLTPLRRIYNK
jgi:F420-0:gamma-glutamyl ligase